MSDLIEFLRARLADDEQIAQRASACYPTWTYNRENFTVSSSGWSIAARKDDGSPINDVDGEHIARHDPTRVLREVEAKRQIIDDCELFDHGGTSGGDLARLVLLALARSYSDDPDFPPGYTEMRETPNA